MNTLDRGRERRPKENQNSTQAAPFVGTSRECPNTEASPSPPGGSGVQGLCPEHPPYPPARPFSSRDGFRCWRGGSSWLLNRSRSPPRYFRKRIEDENEDEDDGKATACSDHWPFSILSVMRDGRSASSTI